MIWGFAMGDVGDYWREHREYRRRKGLPAKSPKPPARVVDFSAKWKHLGFKRFTTWHWQIELTGGLLDYWPSKTKWRYRGETVAGTVGQLEKLIKREQVGTPVSAPSPSDKSINTNTPEDSQP